MVNKNLKKSKSAQKQTDGSPKLKGILYKKTFLDKYVYFKPLWARIGLVVLSFVYLVIFLLIYDFELPAIFGNGLDENWVAILKILLLFLGTWILVVVYGVVLKVAMVLLGKDKYEL